MRFDLVTTCLPTFLFTFLSKSDRVTTSPHEFIFLAHESDSPIFHVYIQYICMYIHTYSTILYPRRGTKVARFYDQMEAQSTGL